MSRLRFRISMSLDGFIAGPNQSVDNPLGVGGERLHEWVVPLAVFRTGSKQSQLRKSQMRDVSSTGERCEGD